MTRRQKDVYEFIFERLTSPGYSPTVREIGKHTGIKSPNGVRGHLLALQRKGFITWTPYVARSITITHRAADIFQFMRDAAGRLPADERIIFARRVIAEFQIVECRLILDQASVSKDGPEMEAGAENLGRTADANS